MRPKLLPELIPKLQIPLNRSHCQCPYFFCLGRKTFLPSLYFGKTIDALRLDLRPVLLFSTRVFLAGTVVLEESWSISIARGVLVYGQWWNSSGGGYIYLQRSFLELAQLPWSRW